MPNDIIVRQRGETQIGNIHFKITKEKKILYNTYTTQKMKIKNLLLLLSIIGLHLIGNAQENVIRKGTKMITGLGSFSSTGSGSNSNRLSSGTLSGSYDSFYKDHMFIGVNLSGLYQNMNSYNFATVALGPEIGYVFGNQDSKVFPYIVGGCGIEVSDSGNTIYADGINLSLGLGVIIPIQKNFGFVIQGKYDNLKNINSDSNSNAISLNFGFIGLLF